MALNFPAPLENVIHNPLFIKGIVAVGLVAFGIGVTRRLARGLGVIK